MDDKENSFNFRKLPWAWILLGVTLWFLFPWIFSVFFNLIIKNPKEYGESFGAVGDIYGSLNALISSIALCAVAYSTYLQVTSLRETRKVNSKQLALAQQAHDEQVKESRNAIFANKFYSLLNFKKDKLNSLSLTKRTKGGEGFPQFIQVSGLETIDDLALEFHTTLEKDPIFFNHCDEYDLIDEFHRLTFGLGYSTLSQLMSYFHIYIDLCNLIRSADINEDDKNFYKSVLSNSMYQHEQILLFWIAPLVGELNLKDTEIFTMFGYLEYFAPYAEKFHQGSHFKYEEWKEEFPIEENPA
ncbi:hypothetical protein [Acinetobacter pittii]|uniref:hypothetical protein n=1 Tax=Acinetobacter pittii TaxID=48296 RepID=UPI000838AD68|nr:hypothetical protein [Acinetobacter pittii]OCY53094.1 hypothetical protein BFR81_06340 [Acinetobacter pittii]